MRHRCFPLLALFGGFCSGCAAPAPLVAPVVVTPIAEPRAPARQVQSVAAPSEPAPAPAPCEEGLYMLYIRLEASPRSPAFDVAARAFDRATDAYSRGRFAEAALGFMKAAESFLLAEDELDRRWSYGNAVSAWERANRVGEGQSALLEAATRDPDLAGELRAMVLDMTPACSTAEP